MHQRPEPGQVTKTRLNQAQLCEGQSCSDIAVEGGDKKTTVRHSRQTIQRLYKLNLLGIIPKTVTPNTSGKSWMYCNG